MECRWIRNINFYPEVGFTTDPTPISYTVEDAQGNVSNAATITVTYTEVPPVATADSIASQVTGSDAVLSDISGNDTLSDGSVVDTTPLTGNAVISIDPNNTDGDGDPLTLDVSGEGVWTYDPATDDLTFTPEAGFTNDPTPIVYTLTETQTGLSSTATVTIDYAVQAPTAVADISVPSPSGAVTLNPLTGVGADTDPDGTIDAMTVSLVTPVGATSEVIDSNGDVTSFAVPGEGTWSVNETTGAITFTPLPTFTNDPTVVSYNVEDNDGNVSNNVTVTIDYVAVAEDNTSAGNTVGSPTIFNIVSNDTNGDSVVPGTIDLDPSSSGSQETTLTVVGEGVWSVDGSGILTFTPEVGFTTDPTPISYTVEDAQGNVSNAATITVTYTEVAPVATADSIANQVTGSDAVLSDISGNDTLSDGSVVDTTPLTGNAVISIDPNNTDGDGDPLTLVVSGEGVWTYDPATDDLTFTPEAGFTNDPTPIVYTLTETQTGLSSTATVTIDYAVQAPTAVADISVPSPSGAVTLNPLTGVGADTDPDGTIDAMTVSLVTPVGATSEVIDSNGDVTSFAVPGEGTWSVNETTGAITFTPLPTFTNDPTVVSYNVEDNDGNVSNNVTVTIDYVAVAVDNTSAGNTVGSPAVFNIVSNDTNGDSVVPGTIDLDPSSSGSQETTLTVVGEGVWSVDGSGILTFTPEVGFTTDPTPISYTVEDAQGNVSNAATITVTYTEVPPVATADSISSQVTGSDAVLSDISGNDTLSDGSVVDTTPLTGNAVISIDPNNTDGDGDPLTLDVSGEGVWTYDPATDDLTFSPEAGFTNDPTPIVYTLTETQTGLSSTATVTIDYAVQAPTAVNDEDLGNTPGDAVTLNVTSNDSDPDGMIDATTVSLIISTTATNVVRDAEGDVTSFTEPGQGIWVVDAYTGAITFTPIPGYTQNPTPIAYIVDDNDGNISNQATVTVDYLLVVVDANDDDFTNSPVNGMEGEPLVGNVLTSNTGDGIDTIDGEPTTTNNVVISVLVAATPARPGTLVPVLDPITGNVFVPIGTPEGTYTIEYSICDMITPNPPGNCDSAFVTVVVEAAPIDAKNDIIVGGNGLIGTTDAGNILDDNGDEDDILNGVSTNITEVTITIDTPAIPLLTGAPVPSVDPVTGIVSIPVGTPEGDYVIEYTICEILNPSNCDSATVTIKVDPAVIDAINDDYTATPINGLNGANTVSVFLNDTLNGVLLIATDITLTPGVSPTTILGGFTMNPDGTITVAPNTPAGTYVYPYTICEVLNPTNCDTAEAIIVVTAGVIDAIIDDYTASPVNGLDGEPNVGNALDNDTLNGIPVVLADVTISIKTPATPIAGAPVPVLDLATGTVSVPVGTPAGTYTIEYTICENLNPSNCDTTKIRVVVDSPAIVAVDDAPLSPVNGLEGEAGVLNVFDNDTLNGTPIVPSDVTLTLITADPDKALTLNGDGTVDVVPGTPAGTYELVYQICEVLNPTNCDIATVTIVVEAAVILAKDDDYSLNPVNSLDGSSNVGNVLENNGAGADTLNGDSVDIDAVNLTVTAPATPLTPGAPVPEIDLSTGIVSVPVGTPAGIYKITYSICEELNPTNCDDAIVTVVVNSDPLVAIDDFIGNVDGYSGDSDVGNVLSDNGGGSDTLNGIPVLINEVTILVITSATPLVPGSPVPMVDPSTGIIIVPAGTPGGTYEIEYQICEILNPANCDIAIVTVIVKESADLTLSKVVDVATPNVGDTVNFTITLSNNGLNNATGVNVVDQLPTGYTFVSAIPSVGTYDEITGSWNVGTIATTTNETLIIAAIVNATGNYTNTAEVTASDQEDPTSTPGNNNPNEDDFDDATTIPIKNADLVTTKIVDKSTANVGDVVQFTISVVNNGPSPATGVSLTDHLPAGLTYMSHTAIGGSINTFTSGVWQVGSLANGGSATLMIKASIDVGQAGNIITNVTTSASGNEVDPTTIGDDLEETVYVTSADLAVTKTVDDATPNIGNTITYVIEVVNNGPDAATSVRLVDNLPVGVTYVSSTTANGTFNYGSGEWAIGTVQSGATVNLTIMASIDAGTIGETITNRTSSLLSDQEDPDITNNVGIVSIVPVGVIDLRLTKTIVNNITRPLVGDQITFEIRVYNDGPTLATGVKVTELVPSGYDFVNFSSTKGTYDPLTGLWNIGNIEVGNTAVLLVDVIVLESGEHENCAEIIAANEDDKDSTPGNGIATEDDYDCAATIPVTVIDLSIVKTVVDGNMTPNVGDVITFEIQLTNNGPLNGTEVTILDNLLPLSYTFVNYSSTVGTYDETTGIWNVGEIEADDIEILLIDVLVEAGGDIVSYTNCTSIQTVHQLDTDSANDSSCITLTPVQSVDLELTKDVDILEPVVGSNVNFTINLSNEGLSTATGVQVVDLLPSGYNFVSATTTIGTYDELTGLWNVGTVLIGNIETLVVIANVKAHGIWLNVAEVTAVNEFDIDSTPNNGNIYEDDMAERATIPKVLLKIPEGFTPDGDGINDMFEIEHLEVLYPNFSMEIVNRYGNKIYSYKHNGNPGETPQWWTGYSDGRWNLGSDRLPAGTYFYTIYFNNNDRKPQTGWVYLRK